MARSLSSVIVLIVALGIVSAVITYVRANAFATAEQIESKGLAAVRRETAIFYAGVAVVFGIIGYFVFRAMHNASPDTAQNQFLYLTIGIGIVFEILAAVVFKMRGLAEFTVLHALFIAAYGWILPRIFPV